MITVLLVICFVAVLGNMFIVQKHHQEALEWISLSLCISSIFSLIQYLSIPKRPNENLGGSLQSSFSSYPVVEFH